MIKDQKTLNCLDSFLALFRGTTPDAQINDLIEYMIKSSYFFSVYSVDERYKTMCALLKSMLTTSSISIDSLKYVLKAEECGCLYCRFSSAKDKNSPYFKKDEEYSSIDAKYTASKNAILKHQKKHKVYYKLTTSNKEFFLDVKIDNDGNYWASSLINKVSGYWVSKGVDSTIKNATISHIWSNASNPLYFTSLWNIVIVPTFCNFILDKNEIKSENADEIEDKKFQDIINRVNNIFKAICWELYDVQNKQFGGLIKIDKPDDGDLELAKSYIALIPNDHILGKKK